MLSFDPLLPFDKAEPTRSHLGTRKRELANSSARPTCLDFNKRFSFPLFSINSGNLEWLYCEYANGKVNISA